MGGDANPFQRAFPAPRVALYLIVKIAFLVKNVIFYL